MEWCFSLEVIQLEIAINLLANMQGSNDAGQELIANGWELPYYGPIESGIQFKFVETGIGVITGIHT